MPPAEPQLLLDARPLTCREVAQVARGRRTVALADAARPPISAARAVIERRLADDRPHYGLNTGFGSLSRQRIPPEHLADLQRNLVRSHAAGFGPPLPRETVRAMMLCSAASLARGHSGVRVELVEHIINLLNADITPVVPETGSVGASGDLAPLAAMGLTLIGEGDADDAQGRRAPAATCLAAAGLRPLSLAAKEGLAIINGTHLMAAQAALACVDADNLFDAALTAAAMSIDACRATDSFLDDRVHDARRQPGQVEVAGRLRSRLAGSTILPSHKHNDPRVQDPYSFRCIPQVLGAVRDALAYVQGAVERELGAVTDNPLVFEPDDIVSAGNFHGMPLALPLDVMAGALAHIAGISERRTFWMLSGFDKDMGLPPYLSPAPGLHSGLMIAQYAAAAACNELVGLAGFSSVANIPTSANIEDYNSFGPRSAAKARRGIHLARGVVAVELLCAAEGLEHHRPLRSGDIVEKAHAAIRRDVPRLTEDRPPTPDIEAISRLIEHGGFDV